MSSAALPDGSGKIHGEEVSAGGVVFRRQGDAIRVLLIRDRFECWGLPKGHLEPGERPEDAALREVREETGLERLVLGPRVGVVDWRFDSSTGPVHKHCHFFLIEAPEGDLVPRVSEGISECRWLGLDAAVERISYANVRELLKGVATLLSK